MCAPAFARFVWERAGWSWARSANAAGPCSCPVNSDTYSPAYYSTSYSAQHCARPRWAAQVSGCPGPVGAGGSRLEAGDLAWIRLINAKPFAQLSVALALPSIGHGREHPTRHGKHVPCPPVREDRRRRLSLDATRAACVSACLTLA